MSSRIGYTERTLIHRWIKEKFGIREIARRLGRSPGTISHEILRNSGRHVYRPKPAQANVEMQARRFFEQAAKKISALRSDLSIAKS